MKVEKGDFLLFTKIENPNQSFIIQISKSEDITSRKNRLGNVRGYSGQVVMSTVIGIGVGTAHENSWVTEFESIPHWKIQKL